MAISLSPRRTLAVALVVVGAVCLVPGSRLGVLQWGGDLVQTLVAPVSHPLAWISRSLSPARLDESIDPRLRELQDRVDEAQTALLRAQRETERLRALLAQVNALADVNPVQVRHLSVPVLGSASDPSGSTLRVRAGSAQGVNGETVAVTEGEQLLGRVTQVGPSTSAVLPITARVSGPIRASIIIADNVALVCTLEPTGDGRLSGPVESRRDPAGGSLIEPRVGQVVRLDDPGRWPHAAQMLVVGVVADVEPSPEQPLRRIVVVQPTGDDPARARRVGLRVPIEPRTEGGPP